MFFLRKIVPLASVAALAVTGCATTESFEADCQSKSCVPQCSQPQCELADGSHAFGVAPLHSGTAVPDAYPLGSITESHYALMQANAEAADFCIPVSEFLHGSTDLTEAGRDHVLELSTRMAHTPFPILVEPTSDSELNTRRRDAVVQILADQGNQDAVHRTVISTAYNGGLPAEAALRLAE